MRVFQASSRLGEAAVEQALALGCDAIAWSLNSLPSSALLTATEAAGLEIQGWVQVARDKEATDQHPEWMHCPQHHEWLRKFTDYTGGHPALVAPYIGLNTEAAFQYALERVQRLLAHAPRLKQVWLADIQGPPMGCGCGNPCCRSWDNAPGPKLASTPYDRPEVLFPLEFYQALSGALPQTLFIPVLCPECERAIYLDGVADPDGPDGTDLCQGVPCGDVCTLQYFPRLLQGFRKQVSSVGLLLLVDALEKNHPAFGRERQWAERAHRHYGSDLIPCVEPEDAGAFDHALIVGDAPQNCWPVFPPPGYQAEVPPIMCGYCPPAI